ncbi:MAG: monovalent cation/H+ antiporter complex subunit F [Pseudomonadota bacterium]
MFLIASIALVVAMLLILARTFIGPSLYDRVISVNMFGTCTVLFIGTMGFLFGRPEFLDIALLYALLNFVGTIAVLKFFRYRALGDDRPNAVPAVPVNAAEPSNVERVQ